MPDIPETRYSWIAIPVDWKEAPVTGRTDRPDDFWTVRDEVQSMVKGAVSFGRRGRIAAFHILDGCGQVVWSGYPE